MSKCARISEKKSAATKEDRKSRKCSRQLNSPGDRVLFLQRTIGNQAVGSLIRYGGLQAKLSTGQPGDKYEQEADRVADVVMRMPEPGILSGNELSIRRSCSGCDENVLKRQPKKDEEEDKIQAKTSSDHIPEIDPNIESHIQSLNGGGQPLSEDSRAFFEPRFGRDFSQVRVHTGAKAAEAASAVNARAFTVGRNVVFGDKQYVPGTEGGRRLMAHELTHVVQQSPKSTIIQRAAAGCPTDWNTTVNGDHSRALDMMTTAMGKLAWYTGTTPTEVHDSLDSNFHASSQNFAAWVLLNLTYLWGIAHFASYDCEENGKSWWCGSNTNAKTFWCVPGVDIRVCQPNYFGKSDQERSRILIHEWVHKYGCNFDFSYKWETEKYSKSWTTTALLNADPWSHFVKEVQ